ncbi:MAG TPA: aminotransferase class I/II-fold pyridoxal phosphate-dependent enzyme [Thermoanaerobaculia bacterium]|jgi:histidinol-phosphate aminotransferase|nr:aminotransferase class I/II-fold pyridoxal phosphate-dependent enzyme [Thermoanaerobaculia bacterium]
MPDPISRRSLARLLGAAAGASLLEYGPADALARASTSSSGASSGPIRLNANENPYGPCKAGLTALAGCGSVASLYPGRIQEEMRQSLAAHHRVEPDQIALGCGSSDILRMADSAFLSSGKKIVAAEPTFESVLDYAKVTRAEAVKVAQTADFRHDLPAMAAACDASTGVVYVCNPNNPTGTIVSGAELSAFIEKVPPSCLVLVDEAYHHFVEDPSYKSALDVARGRENVVVARTFSKIYGMAGMRLGYAVGSPAKIAALERCASWDNTSQAALAMGLASLADAEVVPQQRRLLNDTRRWLCAELARQGRRYIPSQANFVMIDVGEDVVPVGNAFRQRGILVGRRFPSMPDWLRVSMGTPEQMAEFVAVLQAVVPARAAA